MKKIISAITKYFTRDQVDVILRRFGFFTVFLMADALLFKGALRSILLDFADKITNSSGTTNTVITYVLFLICAFAVLRR